MTKAEPHQFHTTIHVEKHSQSKISFVTAETTSTEISDILQEALDTDQNSVNNVLKFLKLSKLYDPISFKCILFHPIVYFSFCNV